MQNPSRINNQYSNHNVLNPLFLQNLDVDQPVTSRNTGKHNSGAKAVAKWSYSETKFLIFAYKDNYERLKAAKSSKGKKQVWEDIYAFFIHECENAGFAQSKTIVQSKEKWKSLFDKYKRVKDNNKSTGAGMQGFEFFEDMDSFMGCSDKVEPKHIHETQIITSENVSNTESGNTSHTESPPSSEKDEDHKESSSEPGGSKRQAQTSSNPIPTKKNAKAKGLKPMKPFYK